MPRVICPFCLQPHETGVAPRFICPKYQEALPAAYVDHYQRVPPLWLVTVGFPAHGKTTYLAALTLALEHVSSIWPTSYSRSLDQHTMEARHSWTRAARLGEQHAATAPGNLRPLLISVTGLPEQGSRCLVMYDVAGQIYDRLHNVEEHLAAIRQVSTIWFFVSLDDLRAQDRTLSDLFTTYLAGLEGLHADLRGRNLIVVYTKGDRLPVPDIRQHLLRDPFQLLTMPAGQRPDLSAISMDGYYAEMDSMSSWLHEYTRTHVPGGRPFINLVEDQGLQLVFCVTSALGEDPAPANRLREDTRRFRILDPLLWAVRLDRPLETRRLNLILDAASGADELYGGPILSELWAQLNAIGEVSTYQLGSRRPLAGPGQAPPRPASGTFHPRLIGPVLEQLPPISTSLVITTGPVLDLDDFRPHCWWPKRLLLVGLNQPPGQNWCHTQVYSSGSSTGGLIEALLKLPSSAK